MYLQEGDLFDIDPEEPVYVIGVVSRLIHLPIWTLRILDREGLVVPKRTARQTRLYCLNDLRRLARIKELMVDRGVNVKGIRLILELETEKR